MSFGLAVYNAAGVLVLDVASITVRLIDEFDVAANASGSKTYPGGLYSSIICVASPVDGVTDILGGAPPVRVAISGLTLTWYPPPPLSWWGSVATHIVVFAVA